MLCIVFLFQFMIKICYEILKFSFVRYLWISINIKKLCRYLHNGYPHGYGYGYRTNIYPNGRVR